MPVLKTLLRFVLSVSVAFSPAPAFSQRIPAAARGHATPPFSRQALSSLAAGFRLPLLHSRWTARVHIVRMAAQTRYPTPDAPPSHDPLDAAAQTIDLFIARDRWVERLAPKDLPKALESLKSMLRVEDEALTQIHRRMTDDESSFAALTEQAVDLLIHRRNSVGLFMVDIPLTDLNDIAKRHHLERFTDDFIDRLVGRLHQASDSRIGVISGRLVIADIDAPEAGRLLEQAWQSVKQSILEDRAITDRLPTSEDRAQLRKRLNALSFAKAHVYAYLDPGVESGIIEFKETDTADSIDKKIERIVAETLGPDRSLDTTTEEYLSARRQILSNNISHYLRGSHAGASPKSAGSSTRSKGVLLAEILIEDRIRQLHAYLKVRRDATSQALKDAIQGALTDQLDAGATPESLVLDDLAVRDLMTIVHGQAAEKELCDLLVSGRAKAVPLFKYSSGPEISHFPRVLRQSPQLGYHHPAIRTLVSSLMALQNDPSADHLSAFRRAYRAYRLATYAGLILAFRDPRLAEIFKLRTIEEAVRTDELGAWTRLKRHLQRSYVEGPDAATGRWLEGLLSPGAFEFKRSAGDETGFLVRDVWGAYRFAFFELTKYTPFNRAFPPDKRDSRHHELLLRLRERANASVGKLHPLSFVNLMDEDLAAIAPDPFPSDVKVLLESGLMHRPGGWIEKGQTAAVAPYAGDLDGRWWRRDPQDPANWISMDAPREGKLTEFMVRLGASRVYYEGSVRAGEVEAVFLRADQVVPYQKDRGLDGKVFSIEYLERLQAGHAARGGRWRLLLLAVLSILSLNAHPAATPRTTLAAA